MSPTRRDILKVMLALPVVAHLPVTTEAATPSAPDPVHLKGQGTVWTDTEHRMLWTFFEIYTDDQKAIVVVKNPFDDTQREEVMYHEPAAIDALRTLSKMFQFQWEIPA